MSSMGSDKEKLTAWQDWTSFGLGWAYLILLSAAILLNNRLSGLDATSNNLLPVAVTTVVANLFYGLMILAPPLHRMLPLVGALRDWVMFGAFMLVLVDLPMLALIAAAATIVLGMLRQGATWGVLHTLVVLAIFIAVPAVRDAQQSALDFTMVVTNAILPLLLLLLVAVISGAWAYIIEHQTASQSERIAQFARSESEQLSDLRQRTRAIYELSNTLSASLSYEKILDAALDVGRLSLKQMGRQRLISVVLLFRAGEDELSVVTSRGLSHVDEKRIISGKGGIVGQALKQGIPVTGKDANKDPELQYFVAFHDLKSILCIPLRAGYENYGVLLYGSDQHDAFTTDNIELLTAISTQATVALQNAVLYGSLVDEKERIVEVEEEARKKLARDLHDGPTQTISAIAMRMSYIYRLLERQPDDVPAELKKVEELARKTTKEIRHMLFTLRPLVLENQGLSAALEQLAEKMQETHGQAVAARVSPTAEEVLDSNQQGVIFYIVEEAVNNARKHAQAALISVTIARQGDVIVVEISDNGVGFNVSAVDANYDHRGSLGMVNMRERTELLNGTLNIESAEGQGTTITVVVPIKESALSARARITRQQMPMTKLAVNALGQFQQSQERG